MTVTFRAALLVLCPGCGWGRRPGGCVRSAGALAVHAGGELGGGCDVGVARLDGGGAGGLEAGRRPAERPLAGVVGEFERRRRRVRRQSHRHTSRRSACRLCRPRRPGARGTAALWLPFGVPRRIVSAIHAVTASAAAASLP